METPYAGVATLILAAAALLLASPALRRRLWIWVVIGIVGFTTALGIYAIVHGWLTYLVPLFDQFRAPARALVLWTFAVSVMAAFGVDAVRRQLQPVLTPDAVSGEHLLHQLMRWGTVGLAGIAVPLIYLALLLTQENETVFLRVSVAALALTLATAFWLCTWALLAMRRAGWLSSLVVASLLIGLLFFDLSATGAYTDISPTAPTGGYEHTALVDFLHSEPTLGRIDTRTDINDLWQPDSATLYGLEDVGGIANPLLLEHWHQLWEALGGRQSQLYDMLHITHVVVRDGTPLPDGKFELVFDAPERWHSIATVMPCHGPGWSTIYYRWRRAMPRLSALQAPDFDPRQRAIVQGDQSRSVALAPAAGAETVKVVHHGTNTLTIAVAATSPGFLVLSELWYPGWRATVNGEIVSVMRTNAALRGLAIPAGESTVELWFTPDSWRAGLLAAIAGWVLLLIIFIFEKSPRQG